MRRSGSFLIPAKNKVHILPLMFLCTHMCTQKHKVSRRHMAASRGIIEASEESEFNDYGSKSDRENLAGRVLSG